MRLFPFSLAGKAKDWLRSLPIQSLTNWKDVEEKFMQIFFPMSRYIKAKSEISMFRQGADESFCETWERFKMILRNCPNHGFEDIAQLNIFINGLKYVMKMLLDAAAGDTMMTLDAEQATRIINALELVDSQDQYDGRSTQKKGWRGDTLLAQNQILTQQIEPLTTKMAKLPQQLHVIQSHNQELRCELCECEHSSEQCAYQNISSEEKVIYMEDQGKQDTFQQLQLLDPVSQERMSKMEDFTKKSTHHVGRAKER